MPLVKLCALTLAIFWFGLFGGFIVGFCLVLFQYNILATADLVSLNRQLFLLLVTELWLKEQRSYLNPEFLYQAFVLNRNPQ